MISLPVQTIRETPCQKQCGSPKISEISRHKNNLKKFQKNPKNEKNLSKLRKSFPKVPCGENLQVEFLITTLNPTATTGSVKIKDASIHHPLELTQHNEQRCLHTTHTLIRISNSARPIVACSRPMLQLLGPLELYLTLPFLLQIQ
jgi:hypothetical protein